MRQLIDCIFRHVQCLGVALDDGDLARIDRTVHQCHHDQELQDVIAIRSLGQPTGNVRPESGACCVPATSRNLAGRESMLATPAKFTVANQVSLPPFPSRRHERRSQRTRDSRILAYFDTSCKSNTPVT